MKDKLIYHFGDNTEGDASMKNLLGGKGANLAEMAKLGLPVPPGFTITTTACQAYMIATDKKVFINNLVAGEVMPAMHKLKDQFGFMPLVAVRSGARVSMPGMMDTILNVGITHFNESEWRNRIGDWAALDSHRRLLQMYGETVLGINHDKFENIWRMIKQFKYGLTDAPKLDSEVTVKHLNQVIGRFIELTDPQGGVPNTLATQLKATISAVFDSWNSDRAKYYRKMHGYSDIWGTAVNVQAMVYGNANDKSGSGVLFSRNPETGENKVVGEFLPKAQGEDVVAGTRTPLSLNAMKEWNETVFNQLHIVADSMDKHFNDMQDMEFTIWDGKLFVLQTRNGKRSSAAAFRIAHHLCAAGRIEKSELCKRVSLEQYNALSVDRIDPEYKVPSDMIGFGASGHVVSGIAVKSSDEAVNCTEPCILVTMETTPDDLKGMDAAVGILTSTGGVTSHAAVVARGMDKACIVGCPGVHDTVNAGDKITINGATGEVWRNKDVPVVEAGENPYAEKVIAWMMEGSDHDMTLADSGNLKEVSSKQVYISTLDMTGNTVGSDFRLLVDALLDSGFDRIVIDLRSAHDYKENADAVLWDAFGVSNEIARSVGCSDKKVNTLINEHYPKKFKSRVHLVVGDFGGSTTATVKRLKTNGWSLVSHVDDMGSLVTAKGVVTTSESLGAAVGGPQVMASLMTLLKEAGRDVQVLGAVPSKRRMLFDMWGGN